MSTKNSNDTIGNRFRDLPVCSSVPQPLHHRVPRQVTVVFGIGKVKVRVKFAIEKTMKTQMRSRDIVLPFL
jgi:hypothetical protein